MQEPDFDKRGGLVKALAGHDTVTSRLYLITANAQPAPGRPVTAVDQAAIWGLGRVIGHQEVSEYWGGLIDIDGADERAGTAARICEHLLNDGPEDQIAIRGDTTFVPRLRPCSGLTRPFPTKLTADATYLMPKATSDAVIAIGWGSLCELREKIVAKNIPVFSCEACSRARGITEGDLATWDAKFGNPTIFVSLVEWADRVISE